MAIERSDPVRDMARLREGVNRLFEEALAQSGGTGAAEGLAAAAWRPAVDLIEHGEGFLLRADLPGVRGAEVEISVENGALTIRGERRPEPDVPRERYLRAERPVGRFAVQVSLPPSVDREGVRAAHRDGVLEIVLPRKPERTAGRVRVDVT